ncbi:MAG: DUF3793 family protein [Lachnospiraceae bacterium]|nr:DUF3793 family protein [Lachnospiraceae bacterium]
MFEKYLVENCAPTLASLKTANLFSYTYPSIAKLQETIADWNKRMADKGVTLTVLRVDGAAALIYVYREAYLQRDLHKPGVAQLLQHLGYEGTETQEILRTLRARLEGNGEFPHEIGLFLGYPLQDVTGFMTYKGSNCKCTGCWKVYGDELEASRIFAMFDKCRKIYVNLWQQGRSIMKLTVAA